MVQRVEHPEQFLEALRLRRQPPVVRDEAFEGGHLVALHELDPFGGEDGRVGDDPVEPLRVVDGEVEGDDRPVAPADHVRLRDAEVVEQPHGVGGHLLERDRRSRPRPSGRGRGSPSPRPGSRRRPARAPGWPTTRHVQAAVQQQHRLAVGVAVDLVVEGRPVDRRRLPRCPLGQRIAALRRGLLRGSGREAAAEAQGGGEGGGTAEGRCDG